jgi:hypothetical protein
LVHNEELYYNAFQGGEPYIVNVVEGMNDTRIVQGSGGYKWPSTSDGVTFINDTGSQQFQNWGDATNGGNRWIGWAVKLSNTSSGGIIPFNGHAANIQVDN